MSLHLNGTRSPSALLDSTGMTGDQLRDNFARHTARIDKRLHAAANLDGTPASYFQSKGDPIPHPCQMGAAMLLEQRATPAYAGTVAPAEKARRRRAAKAQRAARRAAR